VLVPWLVESTPCVLPPVDEVGSPVLEVEAVTESLPDPVSPLEAVPVLVGPEVVGVPVEPLDVPVPAEVSPEVPSPPDVQAASTSPRLAVRHP
jgi:hypothetical protein